MGEEYQDMNMEELVQHGEQLLVGRMIDKFTRAIESAGFVYHSHLDAIALLSIGCTAMRMIGISDEQLLESIKVSMINTRKDYDGHQSGFRGEKVSDAAGEEAN